MSGIVIWFTGLPCSGKTTIANAVANNYIYKNRKVKILDGDALRKTISKNLGFSIQDREQNIRMAATIAFDLAKADYVVLCSLITPLKKHRDIAQSILNEYYNLCYVKAPINICIKRDVKGMYEKALKKEIKEFTGISSPYENPEIDEYNLICFTDRETIGECAQKIISYINLKTQ